LEENMAAIQDSYWVIPGRLLAGEYPGAEDANKARLRLRWLLDQGITLWIDLTEEGEYGLEPYSSLLLAEAKELGQPAAYIRLGIPDLGIPDKAGMKQILDVLDAAMKAGQSVYLHCYGGIGRTGTVVGCYLARHGIPGSEAIEQIARWRKDTPGGWKPSPETEEQLSLVLDWEKGD
jgi:protein tyrosine/serine phosphatase